MSVLWQKKGEAPAEWFLQFTAGKDRDYDRFLVVEDLAQNVAQTVHLCKTGILSQQEAFELLTALRTLWSNAEKGISPLEEGDEDIHSAIENRVTVLAGSVAGKLHTGRSRNDQVLCDLRLFVRKQEPAVVEALANLLGFAADWCDRYRGVFLPGYTHTRPAMPSSADAWMEGFMDPMLQLASRIRFDIRQFDRLPLGSAAGYGVPEIPVDREALAKLLGFSELQLPVAAPQLSRGLDELTLIDSFGYFGLLIGRMATDVIAFSGGPDAPFQLSDEQTSGSSIMPQKRNPDVWELLRASAGEFQGFRAHLIHLIANQRSGYHRDLQPAKELLMKALAAFLNLLDTTGRALSGISVQDTIAKSDPALFATLAANRLVVEQSIPFREAYRTVGAAPDTWRVPSGYLFSKYSHAGAPGSFNAQHWQNALSALAAYAARRRERHEAVFDRLRYETLPELLHFSSTYSPVTPDFPIS